MYSQSMLIYLADDDEDDCMLFEEALFELSKEYSLLISKDGEELMKNFADRIPPLPRVLFLDLNMPRKNGFECLTDIKEIEKLKNIPVVIFTTSNDLNFIYRTYSLGARRYICKPRSFDSLKAIIRNVLSIDWEEGPVTAFEDFVMKSEGKSEISHRRPRE